MLGLQGAGGEAEAAAFLELWLRAFVPVFVILDPFGLIPIFLSMTATEGPRSRRRTATRASLVCLGVLIAFAVGGPAVLDFFGITIPAFRVAGGILLFIIALGMLQAEMPRTKSSPEEVLEGHAKEDVSVFPLGIPMLAGPGTIATVTVLAGGGLMSAARLALGTAVVSAVVLNWLILLAAGPLERLLGRTGMNILNRIMGLLLAVMAVQFVLDGVREVLPGLAGRA